MLLQLPVTGEELMRRWDPFISVAGQVDVAYAASGRKEGNSKGAAGAASAFR